MRTKEEIIKFLNQEYDRLPIKYSFSLPSHKFATEIAEDLLSKLMLAEDLSITERWILGIPIYAYHSNSEGMMVGLTTEIGQWMNNIVVNER